MSEYARAQAMAGRLIAQKGFVASIRGVSTPSDPVTGLGGSEGSTRAVTAVKVAIDRGRFSETLTETASCTLICAGAVAVGEVWADGAALRPVIAVSPVEPDNGSRIITRALIGA